MDGGRREDFPRQQHPFMGNGGSATAHQLPAVQRGTHREARAEALGHRRFPANIADVGGSGEDVIRGRQGATSSISKVSR